MKEVIQKALELFRASPEMDDDAIFDSLVAGGVDDNTAVRALVYLPMVYGRILLADSGVHFSQSCRDKYGRGPTLPERPLTADPFWCEVVSYARAEVSQGLAPGLVAFAGRSAEVQIARSLARDGRLAGARLAPALFLWPGPEDEGTPSGTRPAEEKSKGLNEKKWWQFWR